jgi:aminotransferase
VSVPVTEDNDFKLRAEDVRAAITDRTAAVLINSPSNPLSARSWIGPTSNRSPTLAEEHGFTVISDEVYDEMVFDDAVFTSIAEVKPSTAEVGADFDRYLAIGSFSKTYAMTGWRCAVSSSAPGISSPRWRSSRRA